MTLTAAADAGVTRGTATPSRQPTPGGSESDPTDLISIKRGNQTDRRGPRDLTERQARFDDLLAGVYERLRRERVPSHKDQPRTQPTQDHPRDASAAIPRRDHIRRGSRMA